MQLAHELQEDLSECESDFDMEQLEMEVQTPGNSNSSNQDDMMLFDLDEESAGEFTSMLSRGWKLGLAWPGWVFD